MNEEDLESVISFSTHTEAETTFQGSGWGNDYRGPQLLIHSSLFIVLHQILPNTSWSDFHVYSPICPSHWPQLFCTDAIKSFTAWFGRWRDFKATWCCQPVCFCRAAVSRLDFTERERRDGRRRVCIRGCVSARSSPPWGPSSSRPSLQRTTVLLPWWLSKSIWAITKLKKPAFAHPSPATEPVGLHLGKNRREIAFLGKLGFLLPPWTVSAVLPTSANIRHRKCNCPLKITGWHWVQSRSDRFAPKLHP